MPKLTKSSKPPLQCKTCPETNQLAFRKKIVKDKLYFSKICRICENKKSLEYYRNHQEKLNKASINYYFNNKKILSEKRKNYHKERYNKFRNQLLLKSRYYSKNNRNKINKRNKYKRDNDPAYRIRCYISSRIRLWLHFNQAIKTDSFLKFLPYTMQELKEHLEKQFEPWMNWKNHGNYRFELWNDNDQSTWIWQIDHIIPHSTFNYTSMEDEEFKKCWALENLRPLSAKINVIEGTSKIRHKDKKKIILP